MRDFFSSNPEMHVNANARGIPWVTSGGGFTHAGFSISQFKEPKIYGGQSMAARSGARRLWCHCLSTQSAPVLRDALAGDKRRVGELMMLQAQLAPPAWPVNGPAGIWWQLQESEAQGVLSPLNLCHQISPAWLIYGRLCGRWFPALLY